MYTSSMLKKGGIFTIDAILALLISSAVIVYSFVLLGQNNNIEDDTDIITIAYDTLTVLEGSDVLSNAVNQNSIATISQFMNNLPAHICANISIYTITSQQILSANKQNCNSSEQVSIARGAFIANNTNVYYAEMMAWYK